MTLERRRLKGPSSGLGSSANLLRHVRNLPHAIARREEQAYAYLYQSKGHIDGRRRIGGHELAVSSGANRRGHDGG